MDKIPETQNSRQNPTRKVDMLRQLTSKKDKDDGTLTEDFETIMKLQMQKQQEDLRMKASGGWHPSKPGLPRSPEQKLLGGNLPEGTTIDTFLTAEEQVDAQYYTDRLRILANSTGYTTRGKLQYQKLSTLKFLRDDEETYTSQEVRDKLTNVETNYERRESRTSRG